MVTLNELAVSVVLLAIIALVGASAAIGLSDFQDDLTADSTENNVTQNGLDGLKNATQFLDTTGTILGIAVLIGIIVTAFAVVTRR